MHYLIAFAKHYKKPLLIVAALLLIYGGYRIYDTYFVSDLTKAGRNGVPTVKQLLVQIENINSCESGCLERGDIVLTTTEDHPWTLAEQEGFLIIKMKLTDEQAQILVKPWEKDLGTKDSRGREMKEPVKQRQYMIDLTKLGISADDQKGRMIDKVFDMDVVVKKGG